mmetsp:Transcript_109063/g.314147  ORF Transcript_109063/g.314147 Transcript_109063/m.314147 type:complete len:324 (+) Transcript_109063:287-1258(+)
MRLLDELLFLPHVLALLVQRRDLHCVLLGQGLVRVRVPFLLPHAAGLLARALQLAIRSVDLHVELVVLPLGVLDLVGELLHLAGDLPQVAVHAGLRLLVGALFLEVLHLDLLEVLPHRAQGLDLRRELVLLLLQLRVDLGDDARDLVQGLALELVHLRLLDGGLLQRHLGLPEAVRRGVLGPQDVFRSDEHRDLMPELAELGLELLELRGLVAQRGGVVLELLAVHVLVPLHLFVLPLLGGELLAELVPHLLKLLLLLERELLFLGHVFRLLLVHRQARVLVVLFHGGLQGPDLLLHGPDLSLHVLDVLPVHGRVTPGGLELP